MVVRDRENIEPALQASSAEQSRRAAEVKLLVRDRSASERHDSLEVGGGKIRCAELAAGPGPGIGGAERLDTRSDCLAGGHIADCGQRHGTHHEPACSDAATAAG